MQGWLWQAMPLWGDAPTVYTRQDRASVLGRLYGTSVACGALPVAHPCSDPACGNCLTYFVTGPKLLARRSHFLRRIVAMSCLSSVRFAAATIGSEQGAR